MIYAITNREDDGDGGFGNRRTADDQVCGVSVGGSAGPVDPEPMDSSVGPGLAPKFRRDLVADARRGTLLDPEPFRRDLVADARRTDNPRVIIPIHGFNNGWEDSLRFFGELDEKIRKPIGGVTCGFSWPSNGNVVDYVPDRVAARGSAAALTGALLEAMAHMSKDCPIELVVVAHSMGAYVLAKAAKYAAEHLGNPGRNVLSEVLLVAPDLDDDQMYPGGDGHALAALSRRVTIYRSIHDGALRASRLKRAGLTGGRLGRRGPKRLEDLPENVVMINASWVTAGVGAIAAHSHYFDDERVLSDMRAVCQGVDRDAIPGRGRGADEFMLLKGETA